MCSVCITKHELSVDQTFGLDTGCFLESVGFVVLTKSRKTKKVSYFVVEEHFTGDISAQLVITHPNPVVYSAHVGGTLQSIDRKYK